MPKVFTGALLASVKQVLLVRKKGRMGVGGQKAVLAQALPSSVLLGVIPGCLVVTFLATPVSIPLQDPPRARHPPSPCRTLSGSVRHPVEQYICPVKQEALMNAGPWSPGCDSFPGSCALPDRQAVGVGGSGPQKAGQLAASPLLPHVLFQVFGRSELSAVRPCSWPQSQ